MRLTDHAKETMAIILLWAYDIVVLLIIVAIVVMIVYYSRKEFVK
jgi:hypothetical protein